MPYEAWLGNKPDVGHLKTFGCIAYMKVPNNQVTKLSDRSRMTVYMGREPGTMGIRLYDPDTGRILVSRDVVCEETKGWEWNKHQTEETIVHRIFTISGTQGIDVGSEDVEHDPATLVSGSDSSGNSVTAAHTTDEGESSQASGMTKSMTSSSNSVTSSSTSSTKPRNFRLLSDIFNETKEIEMENELLLAGVDEPSNFEQAIKDKLWEKAM